MNPETIVQKQLDTYNARDLVGFLSCYTKEVEIFNFGEAEPYMLGIAAIEEVYKDIFDQSPNLHAHLENRIVFDNKVIDHEKVTGRKGVDFTEIVAIYEVTDGLISRVRFMRKG
ncbi:MAG: nuclear transport factor 2 family protein [Bacteroidota bacterium]